MKLKEMAVVQVVKELKLILIIQIWIQLEKVEIHQL